MKSFINNNKTRVQFLKYSFIGVFSIAIDFIVYSVCQINFNISASYSKIISFIAASCNSFVFNKKITFKSKSKSTSQLFKFVVLYLTSLLFNSIVHDFTIKFVEDYLPFIIATVTSVIINFNGQKYWVFKK